MGHKTGSGAGSFDECTVKKPCLLTVIQSITPSKKGPITHLKISIFTLLLKEILAYL